MIPPIRTLDGGPAWRQTSFFPFMHAARYGRGTVLRVEPEAPDLRGPRRGRVSALEATAVLDAPAGALTLFAVNRGAAAAARSRRCCASSTASQVAEHIVLADDDLDATNTAEPPDRVAPAQAHRRGASRDGSAARGAAAALLERAAAHRRRARSGGMSAGTDAYVIGVDYGTLSGRAVVVRVSDGAELGSRGARVRLRGDRRRAAGLRRAAPARLGAAGSATTTSRCCGRPCPARCAAAGVSPDQVVGIGTDFTAQHAAARARATARRCATLDEFRERPHAYVKLWKHHAAQSHADRITGLAAERGERWLPRYGGRISSEWEFAKALQLLEEDPEIYARMDRWIEAADWIIWQLCGEETRNVCTAGYKAIHQDEGYPSRDYLAALNPGFAGFVAEKLEHPLVASSASARAR